MSEKIFIRFILFIVLILLNMSVKAAGAPEDDEFFPSDSTRTAIYSEDTYFASVNMLKKELELAPNDELLLSELGELQVKLRLMEDAFLTYSRLIQVNPRNYDACLFLGYNYYVKGKNLLQVEDERYKQIEKPKKIQYAVYLDSIREILDRDYKLALQYLSIATSITPVNYVQNIVKEMQHRMLNPTLFQEIVK